MALLVGVANSQKRKLILKYQSQPSNIFFSLRNLVHFPPLPTLVSLITVNAKLTFVFGILELFVSGLTDLDQLNNFDVNFIPGKGHVLWNLNCLSMLSVR